MANFKRPVGLAAIALSLTAAAPASSVSPASVASSAASASLTVEVYNVRNDKGEIRICMTQDVENFLDCRDDPGAVKVQVPAFRDEGVIEVPELTAGTWVALLLHDENANGKMSKALGIPKEGFGFSGNPAIRMGPPRAEDVRFDLPAGHSTQRVKMKYIL
ncbi:DUF2141 domain-containing protein [Sphingomicrobium sediminis]|uniref:DUF2141 domain-containing protein n=1 Tax=Sphingomicrobium sediminis TaxID=2950949 RepID=A0A9X2EF32_9SPHN|nr:DUF2141 domain-containing protein [Sphingomicrobium sediminis]MCM8556251.1 DUF2141 domain-containing protein [Sphingomicrobium sediminis]